MHVRPITQTDLPDFAKAVGLSMWNDEMMAYTAPYREQYPDAFFRHCLYRAKIRFYRGEELFLCVTDEQDPEWTGKEVILGYCCYSTNVASVKKPWQTGWLGNTFESYALYYYGKYAKIFSLDQSADRNAESHFRTIIEAPLFDEYFASLPEKHRKQLGDQHWELELLGTHPDWRRRGVGRLMLEEGKRRARENGVPLVLLASVMGEHLYLSAGFREVNRLKMTAQDELASEKLKELDLGFGKGEGIAWAAMVWEPESMHLNDLS